VTKQACKKGSKKKNKCVAKTSTPADNEESPTVEESDIPEDDLSNAEKASSPADNEESLTVEESDIPEDDLSNAEQASSPADEESATVAESDIPEDDLSKVEQASTVGAENDQIATDPTKEQTPDARDIALLYAQYVLKSAGESADGEILYDGHEIPLQFFVRVLTLQDTDLRNVTIDNLHTIAQLYVTYDLN
jgi:hypothetical protein